MKIIAAPLAVLVAVTVMSAQAPAPAQKADDKAAPAKAADPKAKKEEKKEKEIIYKIPGTTIPRPDGTFLGLQVLNANYVLSFYDKKKKPKDPDVTRALARWPNIRGSGDYRTVLNPSGKDLVGSKPVIPPFNFNIYITLLDGEGDESKAVENYTVRLN